MADIKTAGELPESPFDEPQFQDYLSRLDALRVSGEAKIDALRNEIRDLKLNKQLDPEVRDRLIADDKDALEEARRVAQEKKPEVDPLVKEAAEKAKAEGEAYYKAVSEIEDKKIADAKAEYQAAKAQADKDHQERLSQIEKPQVRPEDVEALKAKYQERFAEFEAATDAKHLPAEDAAKSHARNKEWLERSIEKATEKAEAIAKANHASRMKAEAILYRSTLEEIKAARIGKIEKAKDAKFNAYLERYGYVTRIRNNRPSFADNLEYKYRNYLYAFNTKNWFLRNALYLVAIALFVIFICIKPELVSNPDNITKILSQSSTRLFYSLGVAGLILIAGTDLSIGRMTGMGVMLACLFTSGTKYTIPSKTFGTFVFDMTGMPMGLGIILAIIVPIVFCVIFSVIAGFFTAKFKMHPFITTLSTQLLIYGFVMISVGGVSSFNMKTDLANSIKGGSNGSLLILYAAIATAIIWFIWNKTKFGKYMYAVGGNPEAAKVSGINVFWVIMGIFIMAGVLYGFGGFFEAVRTPVGTSATGYGSELNAIAACVIGGVSFNGGIGKISGVVLGTIIFQGLTYCLSFVGVDSNMQFIFQGAIIMAAVCIDSLKYLKKK